MLVYIIYERDKIQHLEQKQSHLNFQVNPW